VTAAMRPDLTETARVSPAAGGAGFRLLILGGTRFAGRAVAEEAAARGMDVTTFNRGLAGADAPGVRPLRGDRDSAADLAALAAAGPWDAVIDTSGYVPRSVLAAGRALEPVAGRYVFMSSVSAYAGWPSEPLADDSPVLWCPPDAGPDYGRDTEDGPTRYGYQKAGCERAVSASFGPGRSVILRPGVMLGPREYVGRLPWWLRRVAAGGKVLCPGQPGRAIQPADVRDVAAFAVTAACVELAGAYNVTAPAGHATFGALLAACARATGSAAEFCWAPDEVLLAFGVRQWSQLPLWRTAPGVWQVSPARALAAGLRCRPLAETVAATWSWMRGSPVLLDESRSSEIGISRDLEREVLDALAG
jgi:2'-hydroxyisoflavone reductase